MTLDVLTVARFAKQAGFQGTALVVAVAVAHAESGLNPAAVGDVDLTEPGERSVGLWQINYRPSRDQPGGLRDPTLNLQPFHNAVAAYAISNRGASFGPWSTYTSGAYRPFMSDAAAAAVQIEEENVASRIVGVAAAPTGGYIIVTDDGAVYCFGTGYNGRLVQDAAGNWQAAIPK